MSNAFWVALEGPDGCGKSTQAALVADFMNAKLVREPGGTEIGERLRDIILDGDLSPSPIVEMALMAAARSQLVTEVIEPTLASGQNVISDRCVASSLIYQGIGRGIGLANVMGVNDRLVSRVPDLIIGIEVPEDRLAERMEARTLDRIEAEGDDFAQRIQEKYEVRAWMPPLEGRCATAFVDGDESTGVVFDFIVQEILRWSYYEHA